MEYNKWKAKIIQDKKHYLSFHVFSALVVDL